MAAPNFLLLTTREREVLGLTAEGLTCTQIGEKLGLALETVKSHRKAIIRKMGVPILRAAILFDRWGRDATKRSE